MPRVLDNGFDSSMSEGLTADLNVTLDELTLKDDSMNLIRDAQPQLILIENN